MIKSVYKFFQKLWKFHEKRTCGTCKFFRNCNNCSFIERFAKIEEIGEQGCCVKLFECGISKVNYAEACSSYGERF